MTTRIRSLLLPLAAVALGASFSAAAADPQVAEAFASSYKLEARKHYAEAAKPMEALANKGNDFAQLRLAWLAYLQGKYDDSERIYAAVIERKPTALEPRLGRMLPLATTVVSNVVRGIWVVAICRSCRECSASTLTGAGRQTHRRIGLNRT